MFSFEVFNVNDKSDLLEMSAWFYDFFFILFSLKEILKLNDNWKLLP